MDALGSKVITLALVRLKIDEVLAELQNLGFTKEQIVQGLERQTLNFFRKEE